MDQLKELYYDPKDPGSYGGVEKLYRSAKAAGIKNISRDKVKKFLRVSRVIPSTNPPAEILLETPLMLKGLISSGRPILQICRDLKRKMMVITIF